MKYIEAVRRRTWTRAPERERKRERSVDAEFEVFLRCSIIKVTLCCDRTVYYCTSGLRKMEANRRYALYELIINFYLNWSNVINSNPLNLGISDIGRYCHIFHWLFYSNVLAFDAMQSSSEWLYSFMGCASFFQHILTTANIFIRSSLAWLIIICQDTFLSSAECLYTIKQHIKRATLAISHRACTNIREDRKLDVRQWLNRSTLGGRTKEAAKK